MALFASGCSQSSVDSSSDDNDIEVKLDAAGQPPADVDELASVPGNSADQLDAEVVLASALAQAKSKDKNVFVHLGAPW